MGKTKIREWPFYVLAAVIFVGLQREGKLTIDASEAFVTILVGSAAVDLPAGLAMGVLASTAGKG